MKQIIVVSILLISSGAVADLCLMPVSSGVGRSFIVAAIHAEKSKEISEYDFKAAFIYNFAKFVEWSENGKDSDSKTSHNKNKSDDFIICILGDNPFGESFKPVLDKKLDSKKIRLVELESFQKFRGSYRTTAEAVKAYQSKHADVLIQSHFLFLCDSEKVFLDDLLALFRGHAIVTIGDMQDFAKKGGMIGFVLHDNKIRFEVNLVAARKEKINIRSQLLQIAKQVYQ